MSTVEARQPTQTWNPTAAEYHADTDRVSHSMLKQFRKSRRDYYAIYEAKTKAPAEPSDEMDLGTALHTAILEPAELEKRIAFAPPCDRRTKEGKQQWGEFHVQSIGKLVLPWDCRERLDLMMRAINANDAAVSLLNSADEREQSIRWEDSETGLQLKSRLDAMVFGHLPLAIDLKTCRDVSPAGFARAMASLGYHTQAGYYCDGCRQVFGFEPRFVFIAVANCEPFSCAVYEIHPDAIARGRKLNRRALAALAACYESDDFREPHEKQITVLGLPRYESYDDQWEIEP